jgi:hypothetical protein
MSTLIAVALTAMMPVAMAAGAHPFHHRIAAAAGHQVAGFAASGEGATTNEPDPTGDGFIIIECLVSGSRAAPSVDAPPDRLTMRFAAVPQHPLGPTKCRPWDYPRT